MLSSGQGLGGTQIRDVQEIPPGPGVATTLLSSRIIPIRGVAIKAPADMIAVGDGMVSFTNRWMTDSVLGLLARNYSGPRGIPNQESEIADSIRVQSRRHGGIANGAFCDGHVEGMKFQPLFFDESDEALRRWNNDHEPHREVLRGGR